jgi:hypothetical protein
MRPFSAEIAGDSAERWQVELTVMAQQPAPAAPTGAKGKESNASSERWIYVRLGTTTDAPSGGVPVDIAGRQGRVVSQPGAGPVPQDHTYVVVALADGLSLTVHGMAADFSPDELVAVAVGLKIGPVPDLSWLGA